VRSDASLALTNSACPSGSQCTSAPDLYDVNGCRQLSFTLCSLTDLPREIYSDGSDNCEYSYYFATLYSSFCLTACQDNAQAIAQKLSSVCAQSTKCGADFIGKLINLPMSHEVRFQISQAYKNSSCPTAPECMPSSAGTISPELALGLCLAYTIYQFSDEICEMGGVCLQTLADCKERVLEMLSFSEKDELQKMAKVCDSEKTVSQKIGASRHKRSPAHKRKMRKKKAVATSLP
jgi:hypothetical protein